MFLEIYGIYRTYAFDSTACFCILSATLYLLFRPKETFEDIHIGGYLAMCAAAFSLLFQGVLLSPIGGAPIFSTPIHYLYFFCCQVVVSLAFSAFLLNDGVFPKLIYTLVIVSFMQMYRGVCGPLYDAEASMDPALYATLDLATAAGLYACLCGLAVLFLRNRIRATMYLGMAERLVVCYLLLSLLCTIMLPVLAPQAIPTSVVIGLVMSDLPLVYYLFARFTQHLEEERRMDVALAQAQSEHVMYERSLELRGQIRQERHELKNHYFRLQVLAQQGRYPELKEELAERIGAIEDALRGIDTGSSYLDFLLSHKKRIAQQENIPLRVELVTIEGLHFDEAVAGTVLSNLVDNALEASRKEPQPEVTVSLNVVRGYVRCSVSNHVSKNVLVLNPNLRTTKENASSHGYGLKIVRRTLEEANGLLDISVQDDRFVASFMLPCHEAKERGRS